MTKNEIQTAAQRLNTAEGVVERIKGEIARIQTVKAAGDSARADLQRLQERRTDIEADAMLTGGTADTTSLDADIEKAAGNVGRSQAVVTVRALSMLTEALATAERAQVDAGQAVVAIKIAECARLCNEAFEEFEATVEKLQGLDTQMWAAIFAARALDRHVFENGLVTDPQAAMRQAKTSTQLSGQAIHLMDPVFSLLGSRWLSADKTSDMAQAISADLVAKLEMDFAV